MRKNEKTAEKRRPGVGVRGILEQPVFWFGDHIYEAS